MYILKVLINPQVPISKRVQFEQVYMALLGPAYVCHLLMTLQPYLNAHATWRPDFCSITCVRVFCRCKYKI